MEETPPTNTPAAAPSAEAPPPTTTFVRALLDFRFESFVTPTIIRSLYILSLVGAVLSTVGWIFSGGNFTGFLWHLLTAPIVLIVSVVLARVAVELIMLAFRILETLKKIEAGQRKKD